VNHSTVTIFAGHYGSGKTNLAVNYALGMASAGLPVTVCDLDIVNPYFRTADFVDLFNRNGIGLVVSQYANTNLDVPAVPAAMRGLLRGTGGHAVIDLGGDERGAMALGRFAGGIAESFEMLLVVNIYRSMSRVINDIMAIRGEIEAASGVRFTALVNNPNLGAQTTAGDIKKSFPFMDKLSRETGLPVKMTAVKAELVREITEDAKGTRIFPLTIYTKPQWKV
jgi:hypothetical protein